MFGVKKSPEKAKQGLNIIIVGCGKVGSTLIEQLTKEGHDITIIDQNAKKYRKSQINMTLWDWLATEPATASRWKLELTTLI